MELLVKRYVFQPDSTISHFSVNDKPMCHILEDFDRGLKQTDSIEHINATKVYGHTCIPYGRYEVLMTFSQRFQQIMPLVSNVPGYEGIRMHIGNKSADTLGCLLLGDYDEKAVNFISNSTGNWTELMDILFRAVDREEKIWITITK